MIDAYRHFILSDKSIQKITENAEVKIAELDKKYDEHLNLQYENDCKSIWYKIFKKPDFEYWHSNLSVATILKISAHMKQNRKQKEWLEDVVYLLKSGAGEYYLSYPHNVVAKKMLENNDDG